jgi:RNA 2',3'-cyclic 3'-phosphodiesterase
LRLFVALDVPADIRAALRAFIQPLRPLCPGARWTRPEGQHVTLKFLGEVGEERLDAIQSLLGTIRSPEPVSMHFRGTGFFPNPRHPRVFWAGVDATPNLAPLAADVEGALVALGFPQDQRLFQPHLTLARFPDPGDEGRLHEALAGQNGISFGDVTTAEFFLFQSHLKPGGAEYTRLETFRFVEKIS